MMSWMMWTRHDSNDVTKSWIYGAAEKRAQAKAIEDAGVKTD
jgi:hypothetical protein